MVFSVKNLVVFYSRKPIKMKSDAANCGFTQVQKFKIEKSFSCLGGCLFIFQSRPVKVSYITITCRKANLSLQLHQIKAFSACVFSTSAVGSLSLPCKILSGLVPDHYSEEDLIT